ncbi:MAG: hypothetical protein PHY02_02415 [Phycisphaerae bacterium]|nr:hypothetical protein [Phycisphaerae bacterium]
MSKLTQTCRKIAETYAKFATIFGVYAHLIEKFYRGERREKLTTDEHGLKEGVGNFGVEKELGLGTMEERVKN